MAGSETPLGLLMMEMKQRRDEGVQIPPAFHQAVAALNPQQDAWNEDKVWPLYDELMAMPEDAALAANEPNDLAAIRSLRPGGPRDLHWTPCDAELLDRLHGAWTGRATGCALGKPVEGWGMSELDGKPDGRRRIKRYLEAMGAWPLRDFIPAGKAAGLEMPSSPSTRDRIAFMESDDDIHYSLVGLGILESYGPDFNWRQVARYWLDHIPVTNIFTAEQQAILNLQNRTQCGWPEAPNYAATPQFTRRHRNPYREWIGAQIRADGFAWCCAGKPELAAEFAWRDASWTHERSGIYGEMMFAAIEAAAFVEHDPRQLVEIGLSEIPRDCRLARATRQMLEYIARRRDWENCMAEVERLCAEISPDYRWGDRDIPGMHPIHTINNALICVLAMCCGRMDTLEAPAVAVMCGLDTDCNGATVGSIVGAAAGRAAFDNTLAGRLNDTIKARMLGFQDITMRELAERTAVQWKRVQQHHASL